MYPPIIHSYFLSYFDCQHGTSWSSDWLLRQSQNCCGAIFLHQIRNVEDENIPVNQAQFLTLDYYWEIPWHFCENNIRVRCNFMRRCVFTKTVHATRNNKTIYRYWVYSNQNSLFQKGKLSCIRTESESGSDKMSLRQSASKQTSKNSTQPSDCSSQDHKCPCCFRQEKKKKYRSKERESRFYNNDVTFKANFKYKNTTRRTHSMKEHVENNRVSSLRRETKTAQTLSLVVGGFVACWLPFFLYYLLTPFIPSNYVNPVLMYILTWLGWFNSAINPFIYAFYSPDFRVAFWRLTIKKCKRNKR